MAFQFSDVVLHGVFQVLQVILLLQVLAQSDCRLTYRFHVFSFCIAIVDYDVFPQNCHVFLLKKMNKTVDFGIVKSSHGWPQTGWAKHQRIFQPHLGMPNLVQIHQKHEKPHANIGSSGFWQKKKNHLFKSFLAPHERSDRPLLAASLSPGLWKSAWLLGAP